MKAAIRRLMIALALLLCASALAAQKPIPCPAGWPAGAKALDLTASSPYPMLSIKARLEPSESAAATGNGAPETRFAMGYNADGWNVRIECDLLSADEGKRREDRLAPEQVDIMFVPGPGAPIYRLTARPSDRMLQVSPGADGHDIQRFLSQLDSHKFSACSERLLIAVRGRRRA